MKKISALVLLFVFALVVFGATGANAMKGTHKKTNKTMKKQFLLKKPRAADYKF